MANLLNRFNESVAGSNTKIADYLSTVAVAGDFRRIRNLEVILNSWNNILITPRRSYQYDPEYGSDLYKLVFEPADDITLDKVINEVKNTLMRYDDRATIDDIDVIFFSNQKGFSLTIDVEYEGDKKQLNTILDESTYFKFFETTDNF